MKIIRFFVWILVIGIGLYYIGALTLDGGKVIITSSVIKESAGDAADKFVELVQDEEVQNKTKEIVGEAKDKITSAIVKTPE